MRIITLIKKLIPTANQIVWWCAALLIFLWFNIEWCIATNSWRPFTHYSTLYVFLLTSATLFTLPAFLKKKTDWLQLSILLLLSGLLEANLLYCRTYFIQIPLESYGLLGNLKGFTDSVTDSFRIADLPLLLIPLAACFVNRRFFRPTKGSTKYTKILYVGVLILCIAMSYATLAGRGGFMKRFETLQRSVNELQIITPVYTVFLPLAYEAMTLDKEISSEEAEAVEQWLNRHHALTEAYISPIDSTAQRLILILCESLESWPIDTTIEGREITPFLNRLTADSTIYFNPMVETQTRDGRSIDAQILYLAGQYPLTKGVYSQKCVEYPYQTLVMEMEAQGAQSYIFSADRPITWNAAGIDRAFGFDNFYMGDVLDLPDPTETMPADGELYRRIADILPTLDAWKEGGKAFGMTVTLTGHTPFTFTPEEEQYNLTGDYPQWLRNIIVTATYVDKSLEYFINYLRTLPDADKTIIAITGDHECLASLRNELSDNSCPFVDRGKHTPLILINSPYSGCDSTAIGQVDVYSALLDAAGLYNRAKWKGMGFSPFAPKDECHKEHTDSAQYISDLMLRHSIPPIK